MAYPIFCQRYRAAAVVCGGAAALIGLTALAGWALGNEVLQGTAFAGIDRHLVKPVQPGTLMALLAELRDAPHEQRRATDGTESRGFERV